MIGKSIISSQKIHPINDNQNPKQIGQVISLTKKQL